MRMSKSKSDSNRLQATVIENNTTLIKGFYIDKNSKFLYSWPCHMTNQIKITNSTLLDAMEQAFTV